MAAHPPAVDWPDNAAIHGHQDIDGWFTASHLFPGDRPSPTPNMPDAIRNTDDLNHMVTGYDAEIRYTDHHVQQVLDALGDLGGLDDTAVIISADHGEAMGPRMRRRMHTPHPAGHQMAGGYAARFHLRRPAV